MERVAGALVFAPREAQRAVLADLERRPATGADAPRAGRAGPEPRIAEDAFGDGGIHHRGGPFEVGRGHARLRNDPLARRHGGDAVDLGRGRRLGYFAAFGDPDRLVEGRDDRDEALESQHLEDHADLRRHPCEDQHAAVLLEEVVVADQLAEAGGTDVAHLLAVDDDGLRAAFARLGQRALEAVEGVVVEDAGGVDGDQSVGSRRGPEREPMLHVSAPSRPRPDPGTWSA